MKKAKTICPACGKEATVANKWVKNQYGMKYHYKIYKHASSSHYVNKNASTPGNHKKGMVKEAIVEVMKSEDRKEVTLNTTDIYKVMKNVLPGIGLASVKYNLKKMIESGEIRRSNRNGIAVYALSHPHHAGFVINSLAIELLDADKDGCFKEHKYSYTLTNTDSKPLSFIRIRLVGDPPASIEDLRFNAITRPTMKPIESRIMEDTPNQKIILLRLATPLLPGEEKEISFNYTWAEPNHFFVFSASTGIGSFRFQLSGNATNFKATMTSSNRGERKDLNSIVEQRLSNNGTPTSAVKISNVEPLSVTQFEWTVP